MARTNNPRLDKYRDIQSFFVHGTDLSNVIEVPGFFLGVLFFEYAFPDWRESRIGRLRRARHDLAIHLNTEVSFVA